VDRHPLRRYRWKKRGWTSRVLLSASRYLGTLSIERGRHQAEAGLHTTRQIPAIPDAGEERGNASFCIHSAREYRRLITQEQALRGCGDVRV
jgi:hypothetical protein